MACYSTLRMSIKTTNPEELIEINNFISNMGYVNRSEYEDDCEDCYDCENCDDCENCEKMKGKEHIRKYIHMFQYGEGFPVKLRKGQTKVKDVFLYDSINYFQSYIVEDDAFYIFTKRHPEVEFFVTEECEEGTAYEWKFKDGVYQCRKIYAHGKIYPRAKFELVEKQEDKLDRWYF